MEMSVNGIGTVVVTLKGAELSVGDLVMMDGNFGAKKAGTDAEPVGVCVSKNGSYAGVQIKGGVQVGCSDSTLTPGYQMLKATATNEVAKGTTGVPHLVVSVDTAAKTAEIVL